MKNSILSVFLLTLTVLTFTESIANSCSMSKRQSKKNKPCETSCAVKNVRQHRLAKRGCESNNRRKINQHENRKMKTCCD